MATATVKNSVFNSSRGNEVVVFNERRVGSNGTFRGFAGVTRTFAVVCGTEVEVETGCAFKAWAAVKAAGF
jgi:hypothetical protein